MTVSLAHRLRPTCIAEVVGQGHLLGPGAPLGEAVRAGRLHPYVAWGPPGTGKSALMGAIAAQLELASTCVAGSLGGGSALEPLLASPPAVLLVDDLHRLAVALQDALATLVDRGVVVLATSGDVAADALTPRLRSRLAAYRFRPLSSDALDALVGRAFERGLSLDLEPSAREYLVAWAGGDARRLLDVLDRLAPVGAASLEDVVRATEPAHVAYPSPGTGHHDVVTAFVKSLRGSDPDAALYWLASMLLAGEDVTFVARRIRLAAAEDVGLADPFALVMAQAVTEAVVGAPLAEARMLLAEAAAYVATAPKSSAAARGLERAEIDVGRRGVQPVPLHLRQRTLRGAPEAGYSQGAPWRQPKGQFLFPQYLPDGLTRESFYEPVDSGAEARVRERLRAWWPDRY